MKKLAFLMVLIMVSTVVFADGIFDKLQANHKNAMKFYGRADLLAQRDAQMMFAHTEKGLASLFVSREISTGYMESSTNKKIYWEITPIEGGFKIHVKVNILDKTYENTIMVKTGERNFSVKLETGDTRYDNDTQWCILRCTIGINVFKCLSCGTSWQCWATCVGPKVIECIMNCF